MFEIARAWYCKSANSQKLTVWVFLGNLLTSGALRPYDGLPRGYSTLPSLPGYSEGHRLLPVDRPVPCLPLITTLQMLQVSVLVALLLGTLPAGFVGRFL